MHRKMTDAGNENPVVRKNKHVGQGERLDKGCDHARLCS